MVHGMSHPMLNVLCFYITTFQRVCVCVCVCNVSVFCSSLKSHFPGMLLRYFLSGSQMVPVAPVITGITSGCCNFHIHCISVASAVYFRIFLTSFLITFITILLLLLLLYFIAFMQGIYNYIPETNHISWV